MSVAFIPLKAFDLAKGRLAPAVGPDRRAQLAQATAERVLAACAAAGFEPRIITADAAVAAWAADRRASVFRDPGGGLNAACAAATSGVDSWLVVHGDLPLLDGTTTGRAASALHAGTPVIAPARDGGTNLLGNVAPLDFAYGIGSFHRHLAALGGKGEFLIGAASAVELDTPQDLALAATLPAGRWLSPYLS